MRPAILDPKNPIDTARWVLEFPFLEWKPRSRVNPRLKVKLRDPITRQIRTSTFQVNAVLGRGGMGVVFKALDAQKREVAVKIPRTRPGGDELDEAAEKKDAADLMSKLKDLATDTAAFEREQFRRREVAVARYDDKLNSRLRKKCDIEAATLQLIQRENIVAIRGYGTVELTVGDSVAIYPCIIMDYVDGPSLRDKIEAHDFEDLPRCLCGILKLGEDVANEVSVLHDLNHGHRDLSWNNIIVREDGAIFRPVIIDLGNVMTVGETDSSKVFGTRSFIAPEQQFGAATLASDQFSLSQILYRWVSGDFATLERHRVATSLATSVFDKEASKNWPLSTKTAVQELSKLCNRGLHPEQDKRFANMREFAAELRRVRLRLDNPADRLLTMKELVSNPWQNRLCRSINQDDGSTQSVVAAAVLSFAVRQCQAAIRGAIEVVVKGVREMLDSDDIDGAAIEKRRSIGNYCKAIAYSITRIERSILEALECSENDSGAKEFLLLLTKISERASKLYRKSRQSAADGNENYLVFLRRCHSGFVDDHVRLGAYLVDIEELLNQDGRLQETAELT